MAKGDVNVISGTHHNAAEQITVWQRTVSTHEECTRAQHLQLTSAAATGRTAYGNKVEDIWPNWDLSEAQIDAMYEADLEIGAVEA